MDHSKLEASAGGAKAQMATEKSDLSQGAKGDAGQSRRAEDISKKDVRGQNAGNSGQVGTDPFFKNPTEYHGELEKQASSQIKKGSQGV